MTNKPAHQIVRVEPAIERDIVQPGSNKKRRTFYEPSRTPIRCQIWYKKKFLGTIPVTVDDMGHTSDVYFKPKQTEYVDHISFVYGGNVYPKRIAPEEQPLVISPGKPLHLDLRGLKLVDKLGKVVFKAGKGSLW